MKLFWKLTKEAAQYKALYVVAILATLALTAVNLAAPRVLSAMTGLVGQGMDDAMMQAILRLAVILLVLYLARIVFRFMSSYLTHKAAWHLVGDLRDRIYGKLQSLDMGFFHDKQTGDLMSRAINDTRDFELLYAHMIPELITNVVTMVGVFIILLVINWRLALITCFPLPIVMWASLKFSTLVKPYFQENACRVGELSAQLQDSLSGIHEIQSFGQEEYEGGRIHEKNFAQVRSMLAALRASAVFHPTVEFLSSVGSVLVVFFGGLLALHGQVSVEQIVAFMLYLAMFYTPISGLATLLENLQQSLAGAERVALVLETPSAITDADDAADMGKVKGSIEFENVSFHYEEDSPVLKNVSFSCKPGQMIALVGPTGVGKTTTTELLSRFYDPIAGRILIDGQDIRHVTVRSLRHNISPVLQDTFLFNGTIAENIAYAKPDATQDEIEAAAKAANIHDDIAAMTDGYQTQVGERGTRLSGGQKQRIAIARAILRNAPIIVLDEATASVDVKTEQKIQAAIAELSGKHTVIAIAHRLSTIRRADQILVINDGEITERGTHEELLALGGYYAKMHEAQDFAPEN